MKDDMPPRPAVHALLTEGTTVCIRAVEPGDHDQLEGLYAEMSPDNACCLSSAVPTNSSTSR
ncbi:hypothetical protein ACIQUW_32015 [Streptomyces sp. NPDC101117]|uniref:hypothetical protein n=1 Tax=Streptomyces sp. NPDC101117 TaxID=3366108 RepID=UPI0037F4097B